MVDAGRIVASTAKKRMAHLDWLRKEVGHMEFAMPRGKLMALRDQKMKTPGAADTFLKSVRAMYRWAVERDLVAVDPTAGIKLISRDVKGATPWTDADFAQYFRRHPKGTSAHLAVTLLLHTACRISDVTLLGRKNESSEAGAAWISFQPGKRGSSFVSVPMHPDLYGATRARKVVGPTYLLKEDGKPFSSRVGVGNKLHDWIRQAGLTDKDGVVNRSAHGIRKAVGGSMAEAGASVYEIMAVNGHSSPKTSAVYTKGASRAKLAASGLARLNK